MKMATKSPPLGMHEDVIARHFIRDPSTGDVMEDSALDLIQEAAAYGRKIGGQIISSYNAIMANEMATPIANEKRAREVTWQSCEQVSKRIDIAVARVNTERNNLLEQITAPPKPKDVAGAMIASEIRSAFANMTPSNRREGVREALANSEDEVISALLTGPAVTTGMSKVDREALRISWQQKRYPREVDRAIRLEASMQDILKAGSAFITCQFSHKRKTH
jgi:hypothetical protein